MILATIAAALVLGTPSINDGPVKCAVMGTATKANSKAAEYAGTRFPFCCGGCPEAFMKEPTKYLKAAAESNDVIGTYMFCPVSGEKIDLEKAKDTMDYKGVRYAFCCADDKATFAKDPAKFTKTPAKESLVCAVSGDKIASYSEAAGYLDYDGVRYYTCCADCLPALKKDPAGIIAKGKAKVSEPMAMPAPPAKTKKDG